MAEELSHRRVLRIALPMILSGITVPLLGLVDTGVVGHLGAAEPIGAVGIGALILSTAYWAFGFLRMGVTGLAAQAAGRGDRAELIAILMRALLIGAAAGIGFVVAQKLVIQVGLMLAPAGSGVENLAEAYLRVRIWGAPAAICLYAINGWLIARERTGAVLLLQLWVNGLNIALDFAFVLGLGWGVAGVASATLIAEWAGLAFGLWLCREAFVGRVWRDKSVFAGQALRRMMSVNADILIRSVVLQAIFVAFVFKGARFGDDLLAVNQILLLFVETMAYALDGFAFSAEIMIGRAVGLGDRGLLRRAAKLNALWSLGLSLPLALGAFVLGPIAVTWMTDLPQLHALADAYLPWIVLVPMVAAGGYFFDGVFIGATRTRPMRNMMMLSGLVYLVALVTLTPLYGNHGLWAALIVSFVARGLSLAACYPALERSVARGSPPVVCT